MQDPLFSEAQVRHSDRWCAA